MLRGNSPSFRNGFKSGAGSGLIDYLLVGGGGGAYDPSGGGGLGGQVVSGLNTLLGIGSYAVVVGGGGNGGGSGANSTFNSLIALGGAGGGGFGGGGVTSSISGTSQDYGVNGTASGNSTGAPRGYGGNSDGGQGGQGIVIIRYLTGSMTATGGTITTTGAYTVHTFTASGTFARTA